MKRYKFNNLKDFDTNSQAACYLSGLNLPYKTLLALLKTNDFHLKHFALINLNSIDDQGMDLLFLNLTGQDGKIRECASSKIKDFISDNPKLSSYLEKHSDITAQCLNDINPQVCRNMVDALRYINNNDLFIEKVLKKINSIMNEVDITNAVKSYKFNKQIFNLYWNLYALENILHKQMKNPRQIFSLINTASKAGNYTIRERIAKIVLKMDSLGFDMVEYKKELSQDENFYVRVAISSSHIRG